MIFTKLDIKSKLTKFNAKMFGKFKFSSGKRWTIHGLGFVVGWCSVRGGGGGIAMFGKMCTFVPDKVRDVSIQILYVMLIQIAVLFSFLAMGELVVYLTGVPVPSSIIGMLLLTISLKAGVVKLSWVDRTADMLVKNLGFFFIPAAVGVMNCFGVISDQWLPIVGASVISTAIVIVVTGWSHQYLRHISLPRHGFSR